RHLPFAGELDEVRALRSRLAEEDAVVGEDPDRVALDPREAADQRLAVVRLELMEAAAVDEPGDDLARVDLLAKALRDQPVEIGGVDRGRLGPGGLPGRARRG